jgi:plasmid stabilization system protein ParE
LKAGYQLTETAEADLGEILLYVAHGDGVERASHVHDRFVRAFELLAAQRGSGMTRPNMWISPLMRSAKRPGVSHARNSSAVRTPRSTSEATERRLGTAVTL